MTWSLSAGGIDLANYGFYLQESEGVFDASDRSWSQAPVYGRAGVAFGAPTEPLRRLTLTGTQTTTAKTVAAREAAEDQLKDVLRGGIIRLLRNNGTTTARQISGYITRLAVTPINHPLTLTDSRVVATLECLNAYWQEAEPKSRALGTVRKSLDLGTAPSSPILRFMGWTNPLTATYRDAGGAAQHTITVTGTAPHATNDWLDVDMRTGVCTRYASGVTSNAFATWTIAFSGRFPWALDPQDGDWNTGALPTLEVSTGTGVAYWWRMFQ